MRVTTTLLFILVSPIFLMSQVYKFCGEVTDESGLPLIGANVILNSDQATITNIDGLWCLESNRDSIEITISYTGYQTKTEIFNDSGKRHKTTLKAGALLEEIVVTGYGRHFKSSLSQSTFNPYESEKGSRKYSEYSENRFKRTADDVKSTFSIDVDNASYAQVRSFLNYDQSVPKDAVRIEEMINYFEYDYPNPSGDLPFLVDCELGKAPWSDNLLMRIGIQGKKVEAHESPPNNLIFLIDVSGSMSQELQLLKQSLTLLVNQLNQNDRVAIVVYASASGLVLPSTSGNEKKRIIEAIEHLESGGSTAGGEGIKLAYKVARKNFMQDGNNRIILATDGDFNVGIQTFNGLQKLIEKERNSGVYLTALGLGGNNFQDATMELLANKGNGNYYFIDTEMEAEKVLVRNLRSTLLTIANDVKLQLTFNSHAVESYRLVGYETRILEHEDFDNDLKDAGEIGAGHQVTALYEIVPKDNFDAQDLVAELDIRHKLPDSWNSIKTEYPLRGIWANDEELSSNYYKAAGIALFGMLLRDSEHKGYGDWDMVESLLNTSQGMFYDEFLDEALRLVEKAEVLSGEGG